MKEIRDSILDLLGSSGTDHTTAITSVASVLVELLCQVSANSDWSEESITASADLIGQIHVNFLNIANKYKPASDQGEYVTLDELRKRTAERAEKLSDHDADTKSRVKAFEQLMETDTLGFLLLSYLKDGSTSMCTNLRDEKMRDEISLLLRETLFGKGGERSYSVK